MMQRKSIVFTLFFFASIVLAKAQNIDSLESKLRSGLNDSLRLRTLLRLANAYRAIDLKKSFEFAEKATHIADEKNLLWGKAASYFTLARFHSLSGDFRSSAKYNDLALNISFQLRDTSRMTSCYNNLGLNYSNFGKYDEAYFYFTQSYQLAIAKKDSAGMAVALHNMASVFKELGQYDRALDYLRHTQKISDGIKDYEGKAYNFDEIGDIYRRRGQYDSALKALRVSLKVARELKLNANDLETETLSKIAKTFLAKNDNANALAYYDTAYALYKKTDNQFGLAQVDLGRAKVYLKERKFGQALKLMEGSAATARQTNSWSLEIECYENLAALYEQQGDLKKSLSFYKQYKQLEDSLFSQGMQAKLLQDQVRFETASKEDQIKTLTKLEEMRKDELKKQGLVRNILVVAVALTVILLFNVYRSGQRRIRINKLLMEHQEEVKKRSKELEQLNEVKDKFFSIISHDLRSPMNALSGILDLMDSDRIKPEEFSRLNKELRKQFDHTKTLINNLLDWALLQMDKLKLQPDKFDLQKLVDENFRLLSSLHLKQVNTVNQIAPQTFGFGDLNMVNLVLRNLILNGIKFTENGGSIEVASREVGNELVVSVKDTGIGISPDVQKILFNKTAGYTTRGTANEKGTGLGLILCKEFVEKNGGRIWLESQMGKGSTFYFTIKKG
ncbi:MAG: tetratricopeptide repeat-containing sensor histidine kinase [Bacteroidetes bacterium]|nr:tetratricopeptide repeat-containing sensor histidine kinase [Bacteroidota bacterium]